MRLEARDDESLTLLTSLHSLSEEKCRAVTKCLRYTRLKHSTQAFSAAGPAAAASSSANWAPAGKSSSANQPQPRPCARFTTNILDKELAPSQKEGGRWKKWRVNYEVDIVTKGNRRGEDYCSSIDLAFSACIGRT